MARRCVKCAPDIGFLHTGIEKEFEVKTYQQGVTLTDRVDYLAPLSNNLGYCLAAEKLLGLEIPPQAQWMRVMLTELTRLNSHLVWLGTHALDIGAMSVFLYCFREREDILRIFEMFSGQRMMTSYFRIGGLALEPPRGWYCARQEVHRHVPQPYRRIRKSADQQSHLDRPHAGRRLHLPGRHAGPRGDRPHAARRRPEDRCAQGRAVFQLREVRFRSAHQRSQRCVRAIPGARRGDAAEYAHRQAGHGWHAGGTVEGRCAARGVARPGKDEDPDGGADLSLQDRDRRVPRARRRGLPGGGIAARRTGLLHGERWHHASLSRAHADP